ncbi:MAG: bis(5'-nucleosyl)-tetraphosphatase (symmetrical) YqeK [Lachnospiraceae bacterium]|nr:bis(5'-nucleosyl)-tetraphosphatase (symmetrical) YqeK [Lachnospiraceae bacterium]
MKIGILGGTFDPPHRVHFNMAATARQTLGLDVVYLMPCGTPPHKDGSHAASRFYRYEMCRLGAMGYLGVEVSDFEIYQLTPNYSYSTLERFAAEHPGDDITFLMGQDSLNMLLKWVHPERLVKAVKIGVFVRGDESYDKLMREANEQIERITSSIGGHFSLIRITPSDLSATQIRESIRSGRDVSGDLVPVVCDFIKSRGLYADKMEMDYTDIEKIIKKKLKKSRYRHTIGVCYTACALAMRYDVDVDDARLAGLLHDCAKSMDDNELTRFCKKHDLGITKAEEKSPHLLHSKVGAYLAKKEFGVDDDEILHAIAVHTTGCPEMSLLDMVIFVADYIEPNRYEAPRLTEIRQMAFRDIISAIVMILDDTIFYVRERGMYMDPLTEETYVYYKKIVDEREEV